MVIHRRRTVAEPSTGSRRRRDPVTVSVEEEEGALGATPNVVAPRAQPQVVVLVVSCSSVPWRVQYHRRWGS